ncbi:predicted protein [Sclerotinia sclerotiorum 1980 UF-70]|uniref:Uncharacterized protein n=1 Tax=Sclerotinia sclerotiorum (strain ATCC 18683 / 1980 / Ss-1) TaxID=665079 RepID=A7EHG3_SCLS1|nr:predicted protein [Sclerotinia sclerotiorum 1980 UF-70]EDO02279.1 predicted protein [Sclerotinia sclerotiorum 1980 UF-70]
MLLRRIVPAAEPGDKDEYGDCDADCCYDEGEGEGVHFSGLEERVMGWGG